MGLLVGLLVAGLLASSIILATLAGAQTGTETTTATTDTANTQTSGTSSSSSTKAAEAPVTYAVGVLHDTWIDTSRGRTLAVTIRYPIAGASGAAERTNAPAASGTFPLVVFAHGYDVSAATYAALEHELAAAGFIVAAPDFPLSSSAVSDAPVRDIVAQATDVSFLISTLLTPTTRPTPLARAITATKKAAVVGHSDGAVTAAGVAYDSDYADARIGAAVILSGGAFDFPGSWFSGANPALLAIHGDADDVNPYASSSALYAQDSGSKMLVTVLGGSHLGPFTTDPVRPAISALIADFLRVHLSGDRPAASRLGADANVPGELALAASA